MNKSILFITTTNIATNPRLVKELRLAKKYFAKIEVVQFCFGGWSEEQTDLLKKEFKNIEFHEINKKSFKWLFVSFFHKILGKIDKKYLSIKFLSYSLDKRSILLKWHLNRTKNKFNWVIAHNPGAFFPAFDFALRSGTKLGIDVEDYHPGETNDRLESMHILRLMEKTLQQANYVSFAAPLIQKELKSQIKNNFNWFTILNGFPKTEFNYPKEHNYDKLKLVWFSQNINMGRGLEKLIPAILKFQNDVELHLIGNLTSNDWSEMLPPIENIIIHQPMAQKILHSALGDFDIGIAFDPMLNKNRELAITNKIIAYAQAGLHVFCVDSDGQSQFLKEYGIKGTVVNYDMTEIENTIMKLISMKPMLRLQKMNQFENAKKIAWEEINTQLIEAWNS